MGLGRFFSYGYILKKIFMAYQALLKCFKYKKATAGSTFYDEVAMAYKIGL
jgi:hypothetical protein